VSVAFGIAEGYVADRRIAMQPGAGGQEGRSRFVCDEPGRAFVRPLFTRTRISAARACSSSGHAVSSCTTADVQHAAVREEHFAMSTNVLAPWPIVKKPQQGYPVQSLQHLLRAHDPSIPAGFVDGIFGPNTEAKVKAFQQHHPPLVVDGEVGPNTWAKLVITVRRGSTGEAVKAVQEVRKAQDLSDGEAPPVVIDGIFGPDTESWVRGWQEFVGNPPLVVDGIVGPKTWQSLLSGLPF
jgi:hypothetical protein